MAVQERPARSSERCSVHPGSPAVATCDGCGRPMCLPCAVPVRGEVYGSECLGLVLGQEHEAEAPVPAPRTPFLVAIGFAVALATTVLPWTTFGEGSTVFGGWSLTPRWATLAAMGALVGTVSSIFRARRAGPHRMLDAVSIALAVAIVLGSVLEWFRPPFPSRPSIVPWIAAAAGLFAAASALRCLLDDVRAPV